MIFTVNPTDSVVHAKACHLLTPEAVRYVSLAKTHTELRTHLARPDIKDKRSAPGPLIPCPECIEEE